MNDLENYDDIILIDDNATTLFYNLDLINDLAPKVKVHSFDDCLVFLTDYKNNLFPKNRNILLLLDINMPKLSGYEVLEHLEEENEDITNINVIMVTSSNLKSDIEKSTRFVNIIGYIEKPLTKENLISKLNGL